MRTQGWWLNVAKRRSQTDSRTLHYCSIWLGDNRVGIEERQKADNIVRIMRHDPIEGNLFVFSFSEEWLSGRSHEIEG